MNTWATRGERLAKANKPHPPSRILINLVGAPGVGKSTLAAAFVRRNPEWTLLTVDQYTLSGLAQDEAWEALRHHARIYPRAIVESSGLSAYLMPLLRCSAHATIIVTAADAAARRETRIKPELHDVQRFGTLVDLERACLRLPKVYPAALYVAADGEWIDSLAAFTSTMIEAAELALSGGARAPKAPRIHKRRAEDPVKVKARKAVYHALRGRRMTKQPCSVCGTTRHVQAHHEDYSKQLDVVWLCVKHHKVADARRASRLAGD